MRKKRRQTRKAQNKTKRGFNQKNQKSIAKRRASKPIIKANRKELQMSLKKAQNLQPSPSQIKREVLQPKTRKSRTRRSQ